MLFTNFLLLASSLVPALAQDLPPANYTGGWGYSLTNQSSDFNLVIQSHNKTLNGLLLGACHDGAAFEGLCTISKSSGINGSENYVRFQWNVTSYLCDQYVNGVKVGSCEGMSTGIEDPYLTTGIVTWWLQFGGEFRERVSQGLNLVYAFWSNVALTQIEFNSFGGQGIEVAFDSKGLMNIPQYQDDTKEPGSEYSTNVNGTLSDPKPLYRWHVCQTLFSSYHYTTLTWVLGTHSPQNPTCQAVNVKRVFI